MTPTFLDHNATTPLDPRVLAAMSPWWSVPANPSSAHRLGRDARDAVDRARREVAALVGADPDGVVFTSGGTEADALALAGLAPAGALVVSAIEHAAVLEAAHASGRPVTELAVTRDGVVDLDAVAAALAARPALVSVMWANNETGVVQPVAEIAARCRAAGVPFHSDAAQAAGKVPVDMAHADALTLSAHKLYGPQGVGALVVDPARTVTPMLPGGGQQGGRRGGTLPTALIVGFGAAAALARAELDARARHARALRDRLETRLLALGSVSLVGAGAERLPNTVQFTVAGIEGETLLLELDRRGFAVSSGSACASDRREPSHVLRAMGALPDGAHGVVRVSVGAGTTGPDIDAFAAALAEVLGRAHGAVGGW